MNLNPYFKSVLDQDRASIVLCGLDHTILYMPHWWAGALPTATTPTPTR